MITAAGAVLAGTFAVLGTLPVTFLAELGFAVAFGVLLDTIVVRSVLVTALNLDLGRWVWWPSKLARSPARKRSSSATSRHRARAAASQRTQGVSAIRAALTARIALHTRGQGREVVMDPSGLACKIPA